ADRFADAPRDDQVKARFRAVSVNAVEHNLARAEGNRAFGPLDRFPAGRLAAAVREYFPTVRRDLPGVNRDHDALAAELLSPGPDQVRVREGRGVDADLVRARPEHGVHVIDRAQAAADGQRHETLVRRALDHRDQRAAAMGRGCDVEEHHLVGALLVVAQGQFHRIAHIAQPAGLGDAEPHAAGDLAAMHVQAGYDTFSDHHGGVNRFAARESISPSGSQPALAAITPPG